MLGLVSMRWDAGFGVSWGWVIGLDVGGMMVVSSSDVLMWFHRMS